MKLFQFDYRKNLEILLIQMPLTFICQANKDWERIGCVVSEALPDVNDAMDNDKIIKVYFDWIKYVCILKILVAWYAGITVTRNGTGPIL